MFYSISQYFCNTYSLAIDIMVKSLKIYSFIYFIMYFSDRHRFSVAPMMDWTDRHCRVFHRLFTQKAVLYTEMITAEAILNGDRDHLLSYSPKKEGYVVLQIGGSDAKKCAEAAHIAEDYGYDEINVNIGCPSDRVQSGRFGACLMQEPELVANICDEMQKATQMPVTVKCRIGVDDQDPCLALPEFISYIKKTSVKHIIIHARKAWLKGLSPKENRTIPPLDYDLVYEIKKDNPDIIVSVNGGITTIPDIKHHLTFVDGVMVGREAYHNPCLLHDIDHHIYDMPQKEKNDKRIIDIMAHYIDDEMRKGTKFYIMAKHLLGFKHGQAGARKWRRYLTENGTKNGANAQILLDAYNHAFT